MCIHFFAASSPYVFLPFRLRSTIYPLASPMTLNPSAARLENVSLVPTKLYVWLLPIVEVNMIYFLFLAERAILSTIR